jgi:predicted CXXCH cytochrome family protein
MTWNVQCAYCHMTNLKKGYGVATDSYDTTWGAMVISCAQCHGSREQHARDVLNGAWSEEDTELTPEQKMHVCATCHARREELTGEFKVGDSFHDHFRLSLEDGSGMYYLDGQVREEVYEYGSLMMSRLPLKGVTCMHCHEPHSGELLKPVTDNSLCMTCHEAPGWNETVVIDPVAHSHHAAESTGNRCIECHMPVTKYMVRDPRRDHGFTVPDPVLTKELGIPNACNRCHEDQDTGWAIEWTEEWYGDRMECRSRRRARALADAQTDSEATADAILALARDEEVPAWRTILLNHLGRWAAEEPVRALLTESLTNRSPLVRSAAIRRLAPVSGAQRDLMALRDDPVRVVRLDATWSTLNPLERDQSHRAELMQYLYNISDQPAGAVRQAQLAVVENRLDDAEPWIRKAVAWDPTSPATQHMMGRIMAMRLSFGEAEAAFLRASELEPRSADHPYAMALMYAEMQNPQKALKALQKTVLLDPSFGRAWYNLGLAHAQINALNDAAEALGKAEALMPGSPDAPYALATVLLRQKDINGARDAVLRALEIDPRHRPSRQLLRSLVKPGG